MAEYKEQGEHPGKQLIEKINSRSAEVAVIGLGYVGLPLAVEQAKIGFSVMGIDKDIEKVEQINNGENYIQDVSENDLRSLVKNGDRASPF